MATGSAFRVGGIDGKAAISASGSAEFTRIVADTLSISGGTATVSGTLVESNASAGQAIIPAGSNLITLRNTKLTAKSLVYVTPVSNTGNQVVYVIEQQTCEQNNSSNCFPYVVIGMDQALNRPVTLNWWIVEVRN